MQKVACILFQSFLPLPGNLACTSKAFPERGDTVAHAGDGLVHGCGIVVQEVQT